MWRPEEGWENPYEYKDLIGDCQRTAFEAGANAMLEVLEKDGKHTDGKAPTLSINVRPEQSGWLVFVPDKEDTNVGH